MNLNGGPSLIPFGHMEVSLSPTMERFRSSDSLARVNSTSPSADDKPSGGDRGFKSVSDGLEDDGFCDEEYGQAAAEKKRRLSTDQVKALETSFEVENKLEPERKARLALQLGLQPRQVAVWFQNRRARWKTKQLEKEYALLKANYESLKLSYDSLRRDNGTLLAEVEELNSVLQRVDGTSSSSPIREEGKSFLKKAPEETNQASKSVSRGSENQSADRRHELSGFAMYKQELKERSSESESSVLLQEDSSPNNDGISVGNYLPAQFIKEEEANNFFTAHQDPCCLFADEDTFVFPWYYSEQWT